MKTLRWMGALALAVSLGLASGCARNLEPKGEPGTAIEVAAAPPGDRAEAPTAPPGPGYQWMAGHWAWSKNRWVWARGHWEKARPGYVFVAPRYETRGEAKVYVLGGWVAEEGAPKDSLGGANAGEESKASP
jgi:hypothetical protein